MGMAPPGLRSISRWSWLMVRQAGAIKSTDLIAFASISLAPSNLDEDSKAPAGRPVSNVVGRPISGQPCGSTKGVMGFRTSHHSPPTQRNIRRNGQQSALYKNRLIGYKENSRRSPHQIRKSEVFCVIFDVLGQVGLFLWSRVHRYFVIRKPLFER